MIYRQKVKIVSGFYKGYYGVIKEKKYLYKYYLEIYKNERFEEKVRPEEKKRFFRSQVNYLTSDWVYVWNIEPYSSSEENFKNKIELLLDEDNED